MSRRGRSPRFTSLSQALPRVLRRLNLEPVIEGQKVVEYWPVAAGADIARHTKAVSFDDGTLLVAVDNSGWMVQLTYLKPQLLKALTARTKRGIVKDIRFALKRAAPRHT